jgi:hypothetical protein
MPTSTPKPQMIRVREAWKPNLRRPRTSRAARLLFVRRSRVVCRTPRSRSSRASPMSWGASRKPAMRLRMMPHRCSVIGSTFVAAHLAPSYRTCIVMPDSRKMPRPEDVHTGPRSRSGAPPANTPVSCRPGCSASVRWSHDIGVIRAVHARTLVSALVTSITAGSGTRPCEPRVAAGEAGNDPPRGPKWTLERPY